MERKNILGGLAILFFLMILFSPVDSDLWISFLFLGIILGVMWFIEKKNN